jgi:polyphosphate kinase 2 (PPK2 family)
VLKALREAVLVVMDRHDAAGRDHLVAHLGAGLDRG